MQIFQLYRMSISFLFYITQFDSYKNVDNICSEIFYHKSRYNYLQILEINQYNASILLSKYFFVSD